MGQVSRRLGEYLAGGPPAEATRTPSTAAPKWSRLSMGTDEACWRGWRGSGGRMDGCWAVPRSRQHRLTSSRTWHREGQGSDDMTDDQGNGKPAPGRSGAPSYTTQKGQALSDTRPASEVGPLVGSLIAILLVPWWVT
jgi:hypothetical protein